MADETASKQPAYALELAKVLKAAGSSNFACSGALSSNDHPAPLLEVKAAVAGTHTAVDSLLMHWSEAAPSH
jgi:hypothetical protein